MEERCPFCGSYNLELYDTNWYSNEDVVTECKCEQCNGWFELHYQAKLTKVTPVESERASE